MLPAVGGALIGAGGSIVSNLLSNSGNRRAQKYAAQKNVEFWRMQNAYNHPSAQMARLKEAGLNPNLIYGTSPSSAVGNSGDISPYKAPEYKFDNPLRDIHNVADLKRTNAQTNNLQTQNEVLAQDALLRSAQFAGQGIQNAKSKLDYKLNSELYKTSLEYQKESLRNLQQSTIGSQLDNSFKDRSLKDRLKSIYYQAQLAPELYEGQKLQNQIKKFEVELNRLGITKSDEWYWRIMEKAVRSGVVKPLKN
jgi:hypothetical protein